LRSQLVLVLLKSLIAWQSASDQTQDSKGSTPVHEDTLLVEVLSAAVASLIEEFNLRAAIAIVTERLRLKHPSQRNHSIEWHEAPNVWKHTLL